MPTRRRKPTPVDLSRVRRYSIARRPNKVTVTAFAKPVDPADDAAAFFRSLPDFLKAADLKEFIRLAVRARRRNKPFHLLLGAHTIKVGLSPLFIDLMQHGIVTGHRFLHAIPVKNIALNHRKVVMFHSQPARITHERGNPVSLFQGLPDQVLTRLPGCSENYYFHLVPAPVCF